MTREDELFMRAQNWFPALDINIKRNGYSNISFEEYSISSCVGCLISWIDSAQGIPYWNSIEEDLTYNGL